MSKIVNITSKEDKDQKLQDIANSLQELKDVMACCLPRILFPRIRRSGAVPVLRKS